MLKVLQATKTSPNQPLDPLLHKEFIRTVEITSIPGKGRGLIAQDDIQPGSLILASRALAIIFPDANTPTITSPLLRKLKRFRLLKESVASLVLTSPEIAKRIYFLDAGPKLGHLDPNSISSSANADIARIEGICLVNGFQGESDSSGDGPFGLWYLPSFINHDCLSTNSNWTIYNDFMFVRATKLVRKGEEILTSYIDPDQPFFVRMEMFLKHNFVCGCKLCLFEKKEGEIVREKRDKLLTEFKNLVDMDNYGDIVEPDTIKKFVEDLGQLREPEINPFLLQPLMQLGLVYFERRNYAEAIKAFESAFKICKIFTQLALAGLSLSMAIVNCNLKLRNQDEIGKWMKEVLKCVELQYGAQNSEESWRILELLRPRFVEELNLEKCKLDNIIELK